MTPRATRPIPTAQPVNVTVAVNTTPTAPTAPIAPTARPAGNGLAATAAQVIGVIGQVLANGRPRPVPVAQPVGGVVMGGVVGVPVVAPVVPAAVAMPVAVASVVPVGYASQPHPFPTPSFQPTQQAPTAPRVPHATHAPADTGHHHGHGGGGDWDTAGEHHIPVRESEPTAPAVEDLQPDECEPTVEDVQPDAPDGEPIMDECEPTLEDVRPEWDECELPADEGEPAFDDCGGAMGQDFGPEFDRCGGGEFDCGADAGFDTTDGAEWGGGMGDYYY